MFGLTLQILVDSLLLGGVYTLMAVGLSLAFGVTRIINFAHGDIVMYGAYAAFFAFLGLNVDPLVSLLLVALLGGIGGYLLFKVTLEPHSRQCRHQPGASHLRDRACAAERRRDPVDG